MRTICSKHDQISNLAEFCMDELSELNSINDELYSSLIEKLQTIIGVVSDAKEDGMKMEAKLHERKSEVKDLESQINELEYEKSILLQEIEELKSEIKDLEENNE